MTEIQKHRGVQISIRQRLIDLATVASIARQIGLALVLTQAASAQSSEVVVATTGGAYDRAVKEIWFEPFTTATGIKVSTVTATDAEQRTRAQAMASARRVTWDIINNVDIIAESAQNRAFARDLSAFCAQFEARKDLPEKTCNPAGVRISYNATLLAFNTQRFKVVWSTSTPLSNIISSIFLYERGWPKYQRIHFDILTSLKGGEDVNA